MRDLRLALRVLRKSPGFVIVTTTSLALALALCTTTYAVLDAVVNPYVPVNEPERLFYVQSRGDGASRDVTSYDRYVRVKDVAGFYEEMAFASTSFGSLSIDGFAAFSSNRSISDNYLSLLGVQLDQGRSFGPANDASDDYSAIVSHRLWRHAIDGKDLAETTLTFNGQTYDVIGVMPPNMPGDVYTRIPARMEGTSEIGSRIQPIVRLKRQSTVESANAELEAVADAMTANFGTGIRPFQFGLGSFAPDPLRLNTLHYALGGAAIAVLLIACTNLANLMLARGYARRRDLALHTALGATRGQLIRQVVAESAVIVTIGGTLGAFLTAWGIDIVTNKMPPEMALIGRLMPVFNARVFTFALAATVATVLLFGLIPAIRISNIDVNEPLKSSAGGATLRMRGRYNRLAIAEIGLSMILLMGTGLLFKAAQSIDAYEFGYDTTRLYRSRLWLRNINAGENDLLFGSVGDHDTVFRSVVDAVATIPGVREVATMSAASPDGGLVLSDMASGLGDAQINLRSYQQVSDNFFKTLGLSVVSGRDFLPGDDADRAAAILDEDTARLLFRGEDPIGKLIKLGTLESERAWIPVVGVVQNAALGFQSDPDLPVQPKVYVMEAGARSRDIIVRTETGDPNLPVLIKEKIETTVPGPTLSFVRAWRGQFDSAVKTRSFLAGLFGVFGGFALLLAAVGLYGVLTYAVSQRMREFGVRLALGAQGRDVLRLVFHDGVVMVLAGTGLGAFLAMWAGTLFQQWLYTVPPTDAGSLIGAEILLVLVSLVACLTPALQATRADPLDTLRAT